MLEGLLLFEAAKAEPLGQEQAVALPEMKLGEHVVQDYISVRMSLKAHPMQLLRETFASKGYVQSRDIAHLSVDRFVQVAGVVLVRQRPGTASDVIFATIEGETGVANIIVCPRYSNATHVLAPARRVRTPLTRAGRHSRGGGQARRRELAPFSAK